ncbi:MAG: tetratricopeptide repeat protein [Elusimicrobia bacterium]|nr:tetratricopeptide repeat protein [Elusimicrobiota bacterium]
MRYEGWREIIRGAVNKVPLRYRAPLALSVFFLTVLIFALAVPRAWRGGLEREAFQREEQTSPALEKRLDRKIALAQERLKTDPEDLKALFNSGLLKFQKGPAFYPDAIADFEKARQLGFSDDRLFYYLGVMYQGVGLYDFAGDEYRKFLRNRPDDFEISMRLAKLDYAAGRFPEAARGYEILELKYPKTPVVLENLVLARWKNNQDYSKTLLALKGLGGEAAFRAVYTEGRIAYDLKDYAKAAASLKSTLANAEYSPLIDRAQAYWLLGDSSLKLKDNDGAFSAFSELLKINPAHEEAKSLLARLERARKAAAQKAAESERRQRKTQESRRK